MWGLAMRLKKAEKIVLFGILSFIMGAAAGSVVWMLLRIMDKGIELLWERIPEMLGILGQTAVGGDACGSLAYDIGVCLAGGLLIGLWKKKHSVSPEPLEVVIEKVKSEKGYPYNKVHILTVSALLPLIFGGAVGPEAGLAGVVAGLCTLIGDRLKYKGDAVRNAAGAGLAATLGVVFAAPLFGIAGNLEEKDWGRGRAYAPAEGREPILSKGGRAVIYGLAVAGAMLTVKGLSSLLGGMNGLPRFSGQRTLSFTRMILQWKWGLLLIAAGILTAMLFIVFNKLTRAVGTVLSRHGMISCLIAGLLLGIVGHFCGSGRFSGETQMTALISSWPGFAAGTILVFGVVKLLMVNVSVNLGWKGGTIFPMIYSAAAVGFAVAALIGAAAGTGAIEGNFAVAVVSASMLGFLMRKPVTVVAVLLLCFPVTFLPALIIAAFISAMFGKFLSHEKQPPSEDDCRRDSGGRDKIGRRQRNGYGMKMTKE